MKKKVLIANLGDATWEEYGGFFVFDTEYGIRIETFDPESNHSDRIPIYRFGCDKYYLVPKDIDSNDHAFAMVTVPNGIPGFHKPWFDIAAVAKTCGQDKFELIENLCSDDALKRAWVYQCIIGHYSEDEFDQYPLIVTQKELEDRYKEFFEEK